MMRLECPICCLEAHARYRWAFNRKLCHCPACGVLFSDPMPSPQEIDEFYQGFLYRRPDIVEIDQLIVRKQAELIRLFGDSIKAGRTFLDYGGGTGVATLAAAKLGLHVTFFEIDRQAVEFVQELTKGLPVSTCDTLSDLNGQRFDIIFVDNVIEHVREPRALIEQLYSRLAQGGQLIFKTPHARSTELLFHPAVSVGSYLRRVLQYNGVQKALSAAAFRPWSLDPPRHLYSFSPKSLMLLAEQVGVGETAIDYYRIPLWEYAYAKRILRIPRSLRDAVGWFMSVAISPFELASKCVEAFFRKISLLSPGGLTLRIKRLP